MTTATPEGTGAPKFLADVSLFFNHINTNLHCWMRQNPEFIQALKRLCVLLGTMYQITAGVVVEGTFCLILR